MKDNFSYLGHLLYARLIILLHIHHMATVWTMPTAGSNQQTTDAVMSGRQLGPSGSENQEMI